MTDNLEKQKWVLFGTGKRMPFYRSTLLAAGESVSRYADNDRKKWNTDIEGVPVVPPEELAKGSYNIVISCSQGEEIEKQLSSMGIEKKHIFDSVKLFHHYIEQLASRENRFFGNIEKTHGRIQNVPEYGGHSVLIDAYDGIGWGGMEMWSYRVAEGLQRKGHKVIVYGAEEQIKQPKWEQFICRFPYDHEHEDCWWAEVENLMESMENYLPFTLVNNWSAQVLGAAIVVKRKYPDLVRIVTVVHNDAEFLYRRVEEFEDEMDVILCVSRHIKDKLGEKYGLDRQKLCSRMNFMIPSENKNSGGNVRQSISNKSINNKSVENKESGADIAGRNLRQEGEPLRIGWGGRLEVIQKRADLITELITRLDAEGVCYQMEIAGNGDYSEKLGKWVEKNGKTNHVQILGYIRPEDMSGFWSRQHIYMNLSDYEGSSLAMLEAMSYGAVPVVTEVSGVAEAVVNGVNGFAVPTGSIEGIARGICILAQDEDLRRRFSAECQRIVSKNCRFDDYVHYMENLIFAGGYDG